MSHLTPYVMGVARDVDRYEREVEAAVRGVVDLGGLFASDVLAELRTGPLTQLRTLGAPYEAVFTVLKTMESRGWVVCTGITYRRCGRSRQSRWILNPEANIPALADPKADTPPERIADMQPKCMAPSNSKQRQAPPAVVPDPRFRFRRSTK